MEEGSFREYVWKERYRNEEETWSDTLIRISSMKRHCKAPGKYDWGHTIEAGLFLPGGRVWSGFNTKGHSMEKLTLHNCYVVQEIHDSLDSILEAYKQSCKTLSASGGIGMYFGNLAPEGAKLTFGKGTAAGPVAFMKLWDTMASVLKRSGEGRGAMMATINDRHPDLMKFIKAKSQPGVLTNFNVSVLISDKFMEAVKEDGYWSLLHSRDSDAVETVFEGSPVKCKTEDGKYIYENVKARELWDEILKHTFEYSEPGVIFVDRVNDLNNLSYREYILATNPCVTGDTKVLTDKGWYPIYELVDTVVKVWNGDEWSPTTPFSTGKNELLEITFSNGSVTKFTPYHKFELKTGKIVEAKDLKPGDTLVYCEMPLIVEGETYSIDAYSQGFYSGDGTKNSTYSNLYKHNEGIMNRLVGKITDRNCKDQPGNRWHHGDMLPKDFVPINGSSPYCVNWFAGYLDADGTVSAKGTTNVIEMAAKDRQFLRDIGLMLNRLGVNYRFWEGSDSGYKKGSNGKVYWCDATAKIMLSGAQVKKLVDLGMKCERLDLSPFKNVNVNYAGRVPHKVVMIDKLEDKEETYCLTEPVYNRFITNGIPVKNCGEQPLPFNGACDLGAINWSRMIDQPFTRAARVNYDRLNAAIDVGVRYLDTVIDVSHYPDERYKKEQENKRRIGLGSMGVADACAMMGYKYGSKGSNAFIEKVQSHIALIAYRTSIELAKDLGSFPFLDNATHTCSKFIEKFKNVAPNNFDDKYAEDTFEELIKKYGIRNSLILTVAPTGTTAVLADNVSSGLEPIYALKTNRKVWDKNKNDYIDISNVENYAYKIYSMQEKAGEVTVGNPFEGSMATELSIEDHIKITAIFQHWTDAAVSKTINEPDDLTFEQHKEVYTKAFRNGLKGCTTYKYNPIRGQVITEAGENNEDKEKTQTTEEQPKEEEGDRTKTFQSLGGERGLTLISITRKLYWGIKKANIFITIAYKDGYAYEVFFNSKHREYGEFLDAISLSLSHVLRHRCQVEKILGDWKDIHSSIPFGYDNKKSRISLMSAIAHIVEENLTLHKYYNEAWMAKEANRRGVSMHQIKQEIKEYGDKVVEFMNTGKEELLDKGSESSSSPSPAKVVHPGCTNADCNLIKESGCLKCVTCDWTSCG